MMQFRHVRTLSSNFKTEGTGRFTHRVVALAWSPNGYRLAVALADRNVYLFDDKFELMDRFPTKPADKTLNKNYSIQGLCFSPDSTRLAIAQSDDIVFVYKLGEKWEDKKTICNKFHQQVGNATPLADYSVTGVCWPSDRPNEVVFGLANGEVKAGVVKLNKTVPLYSVQSYCVGIAALKDGNSVISAHLDGTIYRYTFPIQDKPPTSKLLVRVPFTPQHVAVGDHIVIIGINPQPIPVPQGTTLIGLNIHSGGTIPAGTNLLYITNTNGDKIQLIAYNNEELNSMGIPTRPFTSLAMSPNGQMFVCGGYDKFDAFALNTKTQRWEHVKHIAVITNLCSINSIAWSIDGSKLLTGAVGGALDIFDVCVRREKYGNNYEFIYTSTSSAILHNLATDTKISITSKSSHALLRIDVYHNRYVVGITSHTIIIGDLEQSLVSEVNLHIPLLEEDGKQRANAKYLFDCEGACVVSTNGSIHVIQYGVNQILFSTRSEHVNAYVLSLAIGPPIIMAHLLDNHSIHVTDITSKSQISTISHEHIIDWLELSYSGTKLLFRDETFSLVLYDIASQEKTTICKDVDYAQWIPQSNSIVASSGNTLYVWYNADRYSDVCTLPCPGVVNDIIRNDVECYVNVSQGLDTVKIPLNFTLLQFISNLKKGHLYEAASTLEKMTSSDPATTGSSTDGNTQNNNNVSIQSMWQELSLLSLQRNDYNIAQRCYAALEDVSKSAFLDQILQVSAETNPSAATTSANLLAGSVTGSTRIHPLAQSRIFALNKQWQQALNILIETGYIQEAITFCKRFHKWSDAIQIATTRNLKEKEQLLQEYHTYLMQTHQEAVAGKLMEDKNELETAIDLYIRGGAPAKAAACILKHNLVNDANLCDIVCNALLKSSLYELCGDIYAARRMANKALDTYRRGNCYNKAVAICRQSFPQQVVAIEEEWADHLLADRQYESAIAHYIEAHNTLKALHAAVEGKSWTKAINLIRDVDHRDAQPYYRRIGNYLAGLRKYDDAAEMYKKGNAPQDAVQMFTKNGLWDKAYDIAKTFMGVYELTNLYVSQAQIVENQYISNKTRDVTTLHEAEKLLVTVGEIDRAVEMYKRHELWDDMVRVVEKYRPDLLSDTYIHLARRFEKDNNCDMAEMYYLRAGDWRAVIAMHRKLNNWIACLGISKQYGGEEAHKQASYAYLSWAKENNQIGAAIEYLQNNNMKREVAEFCCERGEWNTAISLIEEADPEYLPQIWFQYAMALEDEGDFYKAEEYFLKADKPREAIEMHLHQRNWDAALRVCESHDERAFVEVYTAQARDAHEKGNFELAEKLFIAASQPQQAINMYKELFKLEDALRVATQYLPKEVPAIERELFRHNTGKANVNSPSHKSPHHAGGASSMHANASKQPSSTANPNSMNNNALSMKDDLDSAEGIIQAANQAEIRGDAKRAIQLFLKLGPHLATKTTPVSSIAKHLHHASKLALNVMGDQGKSICITISDILLNMNEFELYSSILGEIGNLEDAVTVLCEHHKYSLAEQVCIKYGDNAMVQKVRSKHQQYLAQQGDIETLSQHNNEMAAEVYAKSGQWCKVLELAQEQGKESVERYAVNHASVLVQDGKYRQALNVWYTYGHVTSARNLLLYRRIAQEVARLSEPDGTKTKANNVETVDTPNYEQAWMLLYTATKKLIADVNNSNEDLQGNHIEALNQLIVYNKIAFLQMKLKDASKKNLYSIASKIGTALLKYVSHLHSEKAFFDAGYYSKLAGPNYNQHAYVLLNRFVDIYHLIDDDQSLSVSNKEFADTEIPSPEKTPLPTSHVVSVADFDEIDMWLLDCIPSNPTLLSSPCSKCKKETFIGNSACHVCKFKAEVCSLTDVRIPPQASIKCTSCNAVFNKVDYNAWIEVFNTCPCCNNTQMVQY